MNAVKLITQYFSLVYYIIILLYYALFWFFTKSIKIHNFYFYKKYTIYTKSTTVNKYMWSELM